MNKRSFFYFGSIVFAGLTLVSIPQCMTSGDSSWAGWLSGFFNNKVRFDLSSLKDKENVFPIVVIGSGPAGLSAGLYGARAKKNTLVIEGPKPGGLLTETSYVENWPGFKAILGKDLMKELHGQAAHFGAMFLEDKVEKVDFSSWPYVVTTEDGKTIHALTLIIATGASPVSLGIPGEQEYWGKGVTTCAICDAPFYQDKEVIVVGGGDSAIAEAIQLSGYAKKITIMVRKDKMKAVPTNQDLLAGFPKVSVQYNVEVKKILGNKDHVTGVEVYNNKTKTTEIMPIDGVFLAIGHKPNTELFVGKLKLDEGYIAVHNRTQATSVPGVFAAGDVEDHRYRQAGVSAGDGIKAALDADMFLSEIGFNADIESRLKKTQLAPVAIIPPLVHHVASLEEFEKELKDTNKPVLVDFHAEYCSSCKAMMPHFNAVSAQFKDLAVFISVDIGALPEIAKKYFITKIPSILVFKDGSLAARFSKEMSKTEIQELAAQYVGQSPANKEK